MPAQHDSARGWRSVRFGSELYDTAIYRAEEIAFDEPIAGPAILEFFGTTVVIGPGYGAVLDQAGNVVMQARVGLERPVESNYLAFAIR